MSLSDEQFDFLKDVCLLIQYCVGLGFKVTGGELWRPLEMQKIYVESGRSKTMDSQHLKKLAIDLNFFKGKTYINALESQDAYEYLNPIGEYWESLNIKNRWGGNFDKDWERKDPWVDLPHFERTN